MNIITFSGFILKYLNNSITYFARKETVFATFLVEDNVTKNYKTIIKNYKKKLPKLLSCPQKFIRNAQNSSLEPNPSIRAI